MGNVLIDTSAWIDFFRNPKGKTGDQVSALIESDDAFLTGVVQAELLHGVRGKKESNKLGILFAAIPCFDVEAVDWVATGKLLNALRGKGITVPLTDALIATVAKRHKMRVLTLDKHFQHLPVECVAIGLN